MAINIPTSVFKTYNEAIELFLQTVTIIYPPKKEDCPNCILQTFGGRSINMYQTGGPIPFARGSICPFCHGRGVKLVETTEDIRVRVYWDKKYFRHFGSLNINIPDNSVQIIGYTSDIEKFIKADELIVYIQDSEHKSRLFRGSDPQPIGFKQNPTQYFIMYWKQNG